MKIRKAVIPAAGLGTRFLPATKAQPKEMLPIVDKPTIQFIVEEAASAGIEDLIIITGRTKKAIEDHFDRSIELEIELERAGKQQLLDTVRKISSLINVYYIRQQQARGLGHAIGCARTFVGNEPFAVLLGDDIVVNGEKNAITQLIDVYEQTGFSVIGVQHVPNSDVDKYGIIAPEGDFSNNVCRVKDLVEKPKTDQAPSNIAILGRYILTPELFNIIEHTQPGAGGEIQLTDALRTLLSKEPIYACEFSGRRFDVGDKLGYLAATVEIALAHEQVGEGFARYLAEISVDASKPVRKAITELIRSRKSEA